jgi:hypothetical protein
VPEKGRAKNGPSFVNFRSVAAQELSDLRGRQLTARPFLDEVAGVPCCLLIVWRIFPQQRWAFDAGNASVWDNDLSESEELDGCEEAEGAEHWRYADTAEGSREAGPPFEEIRSRRPLYVIAAMIVAGILGIGAVFHQDEIATIRAADGTVTLPNRARNNLLAC